VTDVCLTPGPMLLYLFCTLRLARQSVDRDKLPPSEWSVNGGGKRARESFEQIYARVLIPIEGELCWPSQWSRLDNVGKPPSRRAERFTRIAYLCRARPSPPVQCGRVSCTLVQASCYGESTLVWLVISSIPTTSLRLLCVYIYVYIYVHILSHCTCTKFTRQMQQMQKLHNLFDAHGLKFMDSVHLCVKQTTSTCPWLN
jgi:hypothetical protein